MTTPCRPSLRRLAAVSHAPGDCCSLGCSADRTVLRRPGLLKDARPDDALRASNDRLPGVAPLGTEWHRAGPRRVCKCLPAGTRGEETLSLADDSWQERICRNEYTLARIEHVRRTHAAARLHLSLHACACKLPQQRAPTRWFPQLPRKYWPTIWSQRRPWAASLAKAAGGSACLCRNGCTCSAAATLFALDCPLARGPSVCAA